MKKLFFVLVLLLSASSIFSQGGFYLAPRIGAGYMSMYNARWVNPPGKDNVVSKQDIMGTFLGGMFGYDLFNTNVGIAAGYFLATNKYGINVNYINPGISKAEYTIKITEIPFIIRLRNDKANEARTKRPFMGGKFIEIGAQYQITNFVTVDEIIGTNFGEVVTSDLSQYYQENSIALLFGLQFIQFNYYRFQVQHGIRMSYTLGDFQSDPEHTYFEYRSAGNFAGWHKDYKQTHLYSIVYTGTFSLNLKSKRRLG